MSIVFTCGFLKWSRDGHGTVSVPVMEDPGVTALDGMRRDEISRLIIMNNSSLKPIPKISFRTHFCMKNIWKLLKDFSQFLRF